MKLVCLSDTHMKLDKVKVPEADILLHAGDLTFQGTIPEIGKELNKLSKINIKHKVIVAGNHDWLFQREPSLAKQMCEDNGLIYLQDSMVEIDGLKIYGSPWQPFFCNWAFNLFSKELKEKWDLIPKGIDVLITHGPPMGILDTSFEKKDLGCKYLFDKVMEIKPKLHVFGHIHYSYGMKTFNDVKFVNASICDESYKPTNSPWSIEL